MIHKTIPFNGDYNGDPNINARKRRWFIYQGSTLGIDLLTADVPNARGIGLCSLSPAPRLNTQPLEGLGFRA